MTIRNFK